VFQLQEQLARKSEEKEVSLRVRQAVQFCKAETGIVVGNDTKMSGDDRMAMERCLVQNFLLKKGMDYFGKKDFIFIDMQGDKDVARLATKVYTPPAAEDDE